jgi:chitodextrinase
MRKYVLWVLLVVSYSSLFAQLDTANISIANFRLHDGTFSWRGTGTYWDRTSFNSTPYVDMHLKQYNGAFRQNFRLLTPQGYDPNYEPGYPLMLVWHGGGERANCLGDDCYYGTITYNPNTPAVPAPGEDVTNLLNNDHNLNHGGSVHIDAWNAAGTKMVGDPSLPANAFPGFVVFPQMLNGWGNNDIRDAVRVVRLLMKKYNIDPDRVYTHGLSFGGRGLITSLVEAPWLFAAAAPMSPIPTHNLYRTNIDKVAGIPMWFFQGGQDTNPTPIVTETTVRILRDAGGSARYYLYPDLGHGTWNTAYKEPDFFPWFLGYTKRDIHVAFGSTEICGTTGAPVKMSVVAGLYAYQWELNGVIIPGATTNTYNASLPGVYRARFSRVSATPTEAQWNQWSNPVSVTEGAALSPVVTQIGSVVLRDLNAYNSARLVAPEGHDKYQWYKDGVLTPYTVRTPVIPVGGICSGGTCPNAGTWTVVTSEINLCPSYPSNGKTVFYSDLAPINIPTPTGFIASLTGPTSVLLRWTDVSSLERNYELWRRKSTDNATNGWTFVALLDEDATIYEDKNLSSNTEYWYKIRAVSNTGRSNYAPGNSRTTRAENRIISTLLDVTPPAPPQNLVVQQLDTDIATKTVTLQLTWSPSPDSDLRQYIIKYGATTILTNSTATSHVIPGLPLNTNYSFTVAADDITGNISAPSNQVSANTYIDGFFYYHGTGAFTNFTDIPATYWTTPEFKGKVPNLSLTPSTQAEFLVFRFYGYIYVTTPGNYNFNTQTNDGVEVYINGTRYIRRNSTVANGACANSNFAAGTSVFLGTGPHSVEVRYFQYVDSKCLTWRWKGPDAGPNLNNFYPVPDIRIRSYDVPVGPPTLLAPETLTAQSNGLTSILLNWAYNGAQPVEYEIYRSPSAAGPFAIINRVNTLTYNDVNLLPGTTYYYKVKTVNGTSMSDFSNTANATTGVDNIAPTAPTNLTLYAATLSSASIGWTASTDNSAIGGYEVWVNGVLHGTTQNTYYEIKPLQPLTNYDVYVIAFDAANNKSTPSNTINFNTSIPEIFYSKSTGNLNELATWGKLSDGSGAAPLNFSTNGSFFIVSNRTSTNTGGIWSVDGSASKIVIPGGVTVTADNNLTGSVEVADSGMLILNTPTIPTFINLGPTSTVQYNVNASQIQLTTYGNLILQGTSNKSFSPGTTIVNGTLTVGNNLALKGGANNTSTVQLMGNLVFSGSQGFTPSDVSIAMEMKKAGTQNISFSGGISLFKLSAGNTTNLVMNSVSPGTLTLGSTMGGGLSLPTGSSMNLGNNSLQIIGAGSINSAGETGFIHVNEGSITLSGTTTLNSHLYFDSQNNQLSYLENNLQSSGTLAIESALKISDGLKVRAGTIDVKNNVTLLSTALKTANLQEVENNGVVIGQLHVQRYFDQKPNVWRYIASPVQGTKISDWQNYFEISGDFIGASGTNKNPSLYIWEPTGWVGYPLKTNPAPYNDNQAPIVKGRGYSAFVRNVTAFTLTNTGTPYQGNVVFSVFPAIPGVQNGDWNLLANPYASTISWSNNAAAWTKVNIGNVIAVRNNPTTTTGQFQYYDAATGLGTGTGGLLEGGRIAQGQAFYISTIGANPQLTITEKAKSTGQQIFYREDGNTISHLRIKVAQDIIFDDALIIFSENGSDTYNSEIDGQKFANGGMFNLSSQKQSVNLAISNLDNSFCEKLVKLSLTQIKTGSYTFIAESPETLYGIGSLTLIDHFTGQTADLLVNNAYTFSVTTDPASLGASRFEIKMTRPQLELDLQTQLNEDCNSREVTLQQTQRGATYELLNEAGTIIAAQTSTGGNLNFIVPEADLKEGINTFQVSASFKGCASAILTQPVIIEKLAAPTMTSQLITTCSNAPALLTVSTNENVNHFEWSSSQGKIKGANTATYQTDSLREETTYFVTPVLANGCKGESAVLTVTPEPILNPEIIFSNDTLYTSAWGPKYIWSKNGEALDNSDNPFFIPTDDGRYSVTVFSGGCSFQSPEFLINNVQENGSSLYNLYPNPTTSENIQIVTGKKGITADIRIMDILGKEIYKTTHTSGSNGTIMIKTPNVLSDGVYFLMIDDGGVKKQIRFIIQNEE